MTVPQPVPAVPAGPAVPAPAAAAPDRCGPLTATQRQLRALAERGPAPAALNLSYAVAIDGPLDPAALAGAFGDLVREHEPLRTLYPVLDGAPVAVVAGEEIALPALRLTPGRAVSPAAAAALARQDRHHGFDLSSQAPIRAELLRLDEQRHVLLLTLHHIAADGWSLYVLREALSRGYTARLRGQPGGPAGSAGPAGPAGAAGPAGPAGPTSAAAAAGPGRPGGPAVECIEQAGRQAEWLASAAAEQELCWWTDRLRGATARPPGLGCPPRQASAVLLRQVAVLPDPLTAALRRLARESGSSLFVLLLTAFQALSRAWLRCAEPVIGTLAANRTDAASAATLGAHYNALLLNTGFGDDPSLAECLLRTSAATISALDHQQLPYPVLARRLEQELGWDAAAVPGLMFLLDRYPLEGLRLDGCRVTGLYLDEGLPPAPIPGGGPPARLPAATTADLIFAVREAPDRLTLSVLYRPAALADAPVLAAMRGYTELLAVMCESPQTPLGELALDELAPGELAPGELARPASEPVSGRAGRREPAGLALREVTGVAPVEAVSPVGVWAGPAPGGDQEDPA